MTTYRQRVAEIERRLGGRRLVFFGTRGTDARPLLEISNFEEVFSQIAPLEAVSIQETCLETIKKERVDLNAYSIDSDTSAAVLELRDHLLRAFGRPSAVIPYRPCAVLTSACFARANLVRYLGLFHEKQSAFEHKPWMETQLAAAGVRVLPWGYYADEDKALILEAAATGPFVLRINRSDGGFGLTLLHDPGQLHHVWPQHLDGFLAAAPLLVPSIPLNVGACVFPGGGISLHPPSLQLIGLRACTNRPFGYCGNDFARIGDLDREILEELERITIVVGAWLGSQGYLGAFGIDALVFDGEVYLVEVNPRFQGCSLLSAAICRELDRPDIFLDHMAAFLALPPPPRIGLHAFSRCQPKVAHVACHNLLARHVHPAPDLPKAHPIASPLFPGPGVAVAPEGILFDARFQEAVTDGGFELYRAVERQLEPPLEEIYLPAPKTSAQGDLF